MMGFRMQYIMILLMAFALAACSHPSENHEMAHEEYDEEYKGFVDYEDTTRNILRYCLALKRSHRLELKNSRIMYDEFLNKVWLEFETQVMIKVPEAREMLVDVVEGLLDVLNNDPYLASESEDFVFTYENVDIDIRFGSFYSRYIDPTEMGMIVLQDGLCYYQAYDVIIADSPCFHEQVESYPKSKLIAEAQREDRASIPVKEENKTLETLLNKQ